jgi:DNA-binding HxlR family transcriptional regulator
MATMKLQKETQTADSQGHGKWYADACGTAFAMELVGERWSMLIIRELMLGGRRFSDLRASLPGISAKVLTERLTGLEQAGVLVRRKLPPPAGAQIYELTEWGYFAEPAIQELGRWAARSPSHDPTLPLSPVGFMLSLRTMLDKIKAKAISGTVGFVVGEESFRATVGDGTLSIVRGETGGTDAVFCAGDAVELAALFYGKVAPGEWQREAGRAIEGNRVFARRFVDIFHLPPKVR